MEDYQTRFYETYPQKAEDHDREFIKKYDEYLDNTLACVILVCRSGAHVLTRAAG